jgi:YD repeat-containing protein
MNLNSQIDWSDTDRIVSSDTRYVVFNGDWWRESSSWQTRQNGSSELTLMGRSRTRLTGLGDGLVSENRSIDPLGNETVACSYLDRSFHTTTQTTLSPGSTLPAETVARCGLTVSSRSPSGVTTTYAYDALGRQISQTDGRGNTSHLVYDAQGRVAKTIDPLGHETTYTYDALGRQISVTDPLNHTVTTAYDAEGHVVFQRGATYPVDYAYNAYGNKVSMTTYRNESLADGNTTHWLYDEPSGCMTNKLYADGKGPSYSYTPDGKLARRTWARGVVTDYTYDNAGNLTRIEYDDNGVTPTISMTYDRVGNLVNATTAGVVTNLYAYDIYGHCTNEWQNDFNLTRYYDAIGRSTGTRSTAPAKRPSPTTPTAASPRCAWQRGEAVSSPLQMKTNLYGRICRIRI